MSRIHESCVASEDIRKDSGADYIVQSSLAEIDLVIFKNGKEIGHIDNYLNILGNDVIVNKIKIYNDEDLSYKLTQKYMGKIVIFSEYNDKWY
jgi:hypothetical protein